MNIVVDGFDVELIERLERAGFETFRNYIEEDDEYYYSARIVIEDIEINLVSVTRKSKKKKETIKAKLKLVIDDVNLATIKKLKKAGLEVELCKVKAHEVEFYAVDIEGKNVEINLYSKMFKLRKED